MADCTVATKVQGSDGTPATMYRSRKFEKQPLVQTAATLIFGTSVLFLQGFAALGALAYLVPQYISLPAITAYAAHLIVSRAQHTGSMEWPWYRQLPLGVAMMEYFNMGQLYEDGVQFSKDKAYIFGIHPHAVYGYGGMTWMNTSLHNPFYKLFSHMIGKVHTTGASVMYYIPFVREMFLLVGQLDVSRRTLETFLNKKHSIAIVIGGEAECLRTENGKDCVVLEGRKGFVRLALRYGADLVPSYTYGNVDTFHISTTFLKGFRQWLQRCFKISIPVTWGHRGTPLPRPVGLVVAIGKPIQVPVSAVLGADVDEELVDKYHALYVKELCALYERYKHVAGYAKDRNLEVCEAPEAAKHKKKQK